MSLIAKSVYPEKQYFGVAFEFGTYGDSLLASPHSMCTIIQENQLHFCRAKSALTSARVKGEFHELFYPSAETWLETTQADVRRAFEGILQAEGYL